MQFKESFNPYIPEYTLKIPFNGVTDDVKFVASNNTFSKNEGSVNSWVGDKTGGKNKWTYFEYNIKECESSTPSCSAGSNNSLTISVSDAIAIESWDEVRKLYLSLVASGIPTDGTFSPSIEDLINMFNDPNRSTLLGDYSTLYTIVDGDCTASVTLIVTVMAG